MRQRSANWLTSIALTQSLFWFACPAWAGNDSKALKLAEQALFEDYLNLEFGAAKRKLDQAISLCETSCSPANKARILRDMGVLQVAGFQQHAKGVEMFSLALATDPAITLDADLSTPEIESAFREAQSKSGGADPALAAAMRERVGPVEEEVSTVPEEPVLAPQEEEPPPPPPPRREEDPDPTPAREYELTEADCPPDFPGCETQESRWADDEAAAAASDYPHHWITLSFQMDFLLLDATTSACTGTTYQCFYGGGIYRDPATSPHTGVTRADGTRGGEGEIGSGLAPATSRVLLGYDYGLTSSILLGLRGGFAFNGGPQKNTNPPGNSFQPIHAEARLAYWFTGVKEGAFRPYAQLSGGMAQVDAMIKTPIADGNRAAECGNDAACYAQPLDVWKKTGTVFVGAGIGAMIAFGDSHGLVLEGRGMQMLGAAGMGAAAQLGYSLGL